MIFLATIQTGVDISALTLTWGKSRDSRTVLSLAFYAALFLLMPLPRLQLLLVDKRHERY